MTAVPGSAREPLPAPWQVQGIGAVQTPGKADYHSGAFSLQGTLDIWNKADGCHLMWQPLDGDAELVACVTAMDNPGKVEHAKASLCIRESLDPGAKSVTMCVTAVDGTQFLYRDQTGGETFRVYSDASVQKAAVPKGQFPCWLKLVRRGNQFSGFESGDGTRWQLAAQVELDLPADAIIGLAASSHKTDILTKASFDHVRVSKPSALASTATNNRVALLTTMSIDGTEKRVVYQSQGIEAPNWSRDGKSLVFNGRGKLFRFSLKGGKPAAAIPTGDVKSVNNDHVLSPDGQTIYFSAAGHLYAVPFTGGKPRRVSNDQTPERKFKYYLHGISPDGETLVYVGAEFAGGDPFGRANMYTIPAAGGPDTRLTDHPQPDDGPEYSPDEKWIYFNSELNANVPGHAQCYRMRPDGSHIQQLTNDERVNWFPHISPDGNSIVYLSFPPGTIKHPANKDVILRRMKPDGSQQADLTRFNGGQGTINVNSWSPDSKHFAFVTYPEAAQ